MNNNNNKKKPHVRLTKEVLTTTDHLLCVDWQNPFRKSHQYLSTNIIRQTVEELHYFKLKSIQFKKLISSYIAIYPAKTLFTKSVQITKKKRIN